MNARNCMTVTIVALATMGIVLATNWPNPLDAENAAPAKKVAKVIKTPTLTVHGCTLSFIPRDKAAKASDEYVVRLKAVNTTDKPVSFDMTVSVAGMSIASFASRSPVISRSMNRAGAVKPWSKTCPVSLLAGQTVTISVPTGRKASSFGGIVMPTVAVDGKQLGAGGFAALVSARAVARTPNGNVPINRAVISNLNGPGLQQAASNTQVQLVGARQGL